MLQNTFKIILHQKNPGNRSGKCGYLGLQIFMGFGLQNRTDWFSIGPYWTTDHLKSILHEENSCVAWQVNTGQESGFTERQPKRTGKDRSLYNPRILATLKNKTKKTLHWFSQPRSCMLPGPPSGWGRDKQIKCYRNVDGWAVGLTAIHLWCAITKTGRSRPVLVRK